MTTTDYRALCAELVDDLEVLLLLRPPNARTLWTTEERLTRARAALSEQPVGPTDEELDEFAVFWWGSDTDERTFTDVIECCSMTAYARAVLVRWGRRP
jgi:hypothetical protein